MTSVSQMEARELLGVEVGASPQDIRRAFRQRALLFHPDKQRGTDPALAAEQFRALTRAYQRLTSPDEDQAWDDLDVLDILTEDFLGEALAQDLPAFDLLYIQQVAAQARQQRHQTSSCSGDTEAGKTAIGVEAGWGWESAAQAGAKDHMWRAIHTALQKRERRRQKQSEDASGAATNQAKAGQGSSNSYRSSKSPGGSRDSKWGLFWEFLSDLVAQDAADAQAESSRTPLPNLWAPQSVHASSCGYEQAQAGQSPGPQHLLTDGREDRRERRRCAGAEWRRRAEARLALEGSGAGGVAQKYDPGSSQEEIAKGVLSNEDGVSCRAGVGAGGMMDSQGGGAPSSDEEGYGQASNDGTRVQGESVAVVPEGKQVVLDAHVQGGRSVSQSGSSELAAGRKQGPRWLSPRNCWLWTKRLLLLKALLMLIRV